MASADWDRSAHERLKRQAPRTLRISLFLAAALLACGAALAPPYIAAPYGLEGDFDRLEGLIDRPEIVVPPPPATIAHPYPPLPAEFELDANAPPLPPLPSNWFDPQRLPALAVPWAEKFTPPPDRPPQLVHFVAPQYPELAAEARAEGLILIELLVDETGRVARARILESDANPALEASALEAALQCLFSPAMQGDRPVRCRVLLPMRFALH